MITRIKIDHQFANHKNLGLVSLKEKILEDGELLGYSFVCVNPKTGKVTSKLIETASTTILSIINYTR